MKTPGHDPADNVVQMPKDQPFMAYPALAGYIENIGCKAAGISISTWCNFLSEINSALESAAATERNRCSNIVASFGTNDPGIQRLQQELLDRIAFPEKK